MITQKAGLWLDYPTKPINPSSHEAHMMFRQLSVEEETEFRAWARENYKPHTNIDGGWHPVIQDECTTINREKSVMVPDKQAED